MALDNHQQWTQDDCINLESAREILNGLIGFRVKWIDAETEKIQANKTNIAKWEQEKAAFIEERKRLNVLDQNNISQIRRIYGAEFKRLMEYEDCAQ